MKKLTALFMSALICLNISSCARSNGTNNTQVTSSAEVNAASGSASQPAADVASADMPDSRRNLRTGDIPDNTVAVIFTPTQPRIGNMYIPENQDDWKKAISVATGHLKDKKYDVYPWADMKPIYFQWTHDGITDTWTLGNDGSFLGEHQTGSGDDLFKNNYIAPEDAAELAKLMNQAYERLEINPVEPGQINDIFKAELIVKDKSYVIEDPDSVRKLEEVLKSGKRQTGTGCSFEVLRLYRKDGSKIDIAIATDGCAVWHSDGIYYKYGENGKAEAIFKLFGIDLPVIVPTD